MGIQAVQASSGSRQASPDPLPESGTLSGSRLNRCLNQEGRQATPERRLKALLNQSERQLFA